MLSHAIDYIKKHRVLLILIIPAFILQMIVMMPSGTDFCIEDRCGMHFWGVHSHDAMWHLEIAATSFQTVPAEVPTYAGTILSGYNTMMDLLISHLAFLGISPVFTLFKIVPVLWFILYTLFGIQLARAIKDNLLFVVLFLATLYFADHFGYILHLYHDGSIFEGTQSFSLQSMTSLLNTQFALTLPLIMMQLIILKKRLFSLREGVVMASLVFLTLGLKFYGGVVSALIAGFYLLELLIEHKKVRPVVIQSGMIAAAALISIFVNYNPLAAQETGSIFTVSPFATVHAMIEEPNMVYLPDMVNARYFLYEQGWSPRLVFIQLFSTALYIFFNFGTRVLGILYIAGKLLMKKAGRFELYVLITAFVSLTLTVLLIQKGDWWNTVQFGYYAIFLSNIFLAILLFDLIASRKKLFIGFAAVIIILTIPNVLRTVTSFTSPDTLMIPRAELEAMRYLKGQPDGVVFNSFEAPDGYPFLDYKTSGYVAAFTEKPLYLAHLGPLVIIGVDPSERLDRLEANDCSILEEVDYIYYVKSHDLSYLQACRIPFKEQFGEIFENEDVLIFQKASENP